MTINDSNWKFLHNATGLSLTYNDMYYRYLRGLGYTGTLQQMIAKSKKGLNPSGLKNPSNAGGITPFTVPLNGKVVILGDSLTDRSVISQGTPPSDVNTYATQGWFRWFLVALDSRIRMPSAGKLAVSGYNLDQISASMGSGTSTTIIDAMAPDMITFMGGRNNLSSDTLTQLKSKFDPIGVKMLATSAKVILVLGMGRAKTGWDSVGDEQKRIDYNLYLAAWCAANPSRAVYYNIDSAGLTDADFPAGSDFNASVHWIDSGSKKVGQGAAAVVASRIVAGSIAALTTGFTSFTVNPTFAGGSTLGTGWTLNAGSSGATVVASKEAGTDAQLLTISGNYSGSSLSITLTRNTTPAVVGSWVAGDELDAILDVDILGVPVGLNILSITVDSYKSNFSSGIAKGLSDLIAAYDVNQMRDTVGKLVVRSRAVKRIATPISASDDVITTQITLSLVNSAGSTPIDIKLRINKAEIRKLV